jgi:hypothetical protein
MSSSHPVFSPVTDNSGQPNQVLSINSAPFLSTLTYVVSNKMAEQEGCDAEGDSSQIKDRENASDYKVEPSEN